MHDDPALRRGEEQRLVLLIPADPEMPVAPVAEHGEYLAAARVGALGPVDLEPVSRLCKIKRDSGRTPSA